MSAESPLTVRTSYCWALELKAAEKAWLWLQGTLAKGSAFTDQCLTNGSEPTVMIYGEGEGRRVDRRDVEEFERCSVYSFFGKDHTLSDDTLGYREGGSLGEGAEVIDAGGSRTSTNQPLP